MEVTLHKRAGDDRWLAFAKPGRRLARATVSVSAKIWRRRS
jgi:hypothetical protein